MVGRVRHHDREQGVARRDPERRFGYAAPGEFADRADRRRDPDFDAQVAVKVDPRRVIYAGLDAWSEPEDEIIKRLGLRNVTSDEIAMTSKPVLDWIKAEGITHLAIHLDLDVLDPALFSPLLFNNPSAPPDAWAGVPRGKLRLEHVTRLLNDVDKACHIAGLAIAEFLPWDMMRLRDAMRDMPLLKG